MIISLFFTCKSIQELRIIVGSDKLADLVFDTLNNNNLNDLRNGRVSWEVSFIRNTLFHDIEDGVPQGTILSPFLFSLYMISLCDIITGDLCALSTSAHGGETTLK